ncbi:unnamed protein product, partial [Ceratitis capitata]
ALLEFEETAYDYQPHVLQSGNLTRRTEIVVGGSKDRISSLSCSSMHQWQITAPQLRRSC